MQTPLDKYNNDLRSDQFNADPAQKMAVMHMHKLFEELVAQPQNKTSLFDQVRSLIGIKSKQNIKGLYIWGGVGRGKTYLVDSFYDCLPFEKKMRIHFHRFMQNVHKELKQLKNIENPLQLVAERLAKQTQILCFDEFHVSDIKLYG